VTGGSDFAHLGTRQANGHLVRRRDEASVERAGRPAARARQRRQVREQWRLRARPETAQARGQLVCLVHQARTTLFRADRGASRCWVANSGCASHSSTERLNADRLDARRKLLVGPPPASALGRIRNPGPPADEHQRRDTVRMPHCAAEREPRTSE